MIKIYKKYEEIFNYLVVGALTSLISFLTYAFFARICHINYLVSNVLSWIAAVTFAFFANKIFVFKTKSKRKKQTIKEAYEFVKYRILSLFIELGTMYLFVEIIKMDDMIAKIIVQIIVIIVNYLFSKIFVFKKDKNNIDTK